MTEAEHRTAQDHGNGPATGLTRRRGDAKGRLGVAVWPGEVFKTVNRLISAQRKFAYSMNVPLSAGLVDSGPEWRHPWTVMRRIEYCENWIVGPNRQNKPMSEEEARAAYDGNSLHTAVVFEDSRQICAITSTPDFVSVEFFDDLLRVVLVYSFGRPKPGKLFLQQAIVREYDGTTDDVARGSFYIFKKDGKVFVQDSDYTVKEFSKLETAADVSGNWEDYPKFGEYEGVIRRERMPAS